MACWGGDSFMLPNLSVKGAYSENLSQIFKNAREKIVKLECRSHAIRAQAIHDSELNPPKVFSAFSASFLRALLREIRNGAYPEGAHRRAVATAACPTAPPSPQSANPAQ